MIVRSSHYLLRTALALVLAMGVIWGSDRLAHAHAHQAAQEIVKEFLTVGLTPFVLGDESRPADDLSLYLWMHQVKPQLENLTFGHWASPGRVELLWIVRIGDTAAVRSDEWHGGREPRVRTIQWRVGDNHYEAAWTGEYARDPAALTAIGAFSFAAFLLLGWWLPIPLRAEQRAWYARLREGGVDAKTALKAARNPRIPVAGISDEADARFEQLRSCDVSAATAMDWVLNEAVEDLSDTQWAWFLIGLYRSGAKLEQCLDLALKPDRLEIGYDPPRLRIRGVEIPMASGVLTYYALYAWRRAKGDGWIDNPRSDKPALGPQSIQAEFLDLCKRLSTHWKTERSAQDNGISAADLHNNRNRIQRQILETLALPDSISAAAVLTALAAQPYLFEKQSLPGKDHFAFRIRLESEHIRLG